MTKEINETGIGKAIETRKETEEETDMKDMTEEEKNKEADMNKKDPVHLHHQQFQVLPHLHRVEVLILDVVIFKKY